MSTPKEVLSFIHTKQTSRIIADATFKEKPWNWKTMKLICGSSPRKKQVPPLIHQISSRILKIVQPSRVNYFFKKLSPTHLERMGKAHTTKYSAVPFAHTGICIYIYYVLVWNQRTLSMVGAHAKSFFRDYND